MARLSYGFFTLVLTILLCACGQDTISPLLPEPSPFQILPSEAAGISLQLQQTEYQLPIDRIQITIDNRSRHDLSYGTFFYIEKKVEGKWHLVMYSDRIYNEYPNFKDFGSVLFSEESRSQSLPFSQYGLEIEEGSYRIVKTFTPYGQSGEISVAAPFKVIGETEHGAKKD